MAAGTTRTPITAWTLVSADALTVVDNNVTYVERYVNDEIYVAGVPSSPAGATLPAGATRTAPAPAACGLFVVRVAPVLTFACGAADSAFATGLAPATSDPHLEGAAYGVVDRNSDTARCITARSSGESRLARQAERSGGIVPCRPGLVMIPGGPPTVVRVSSLGRISLSYHGRHCGVSSWGTLCRIVTTDTK